MSEDIAVAAVASDADSPNGRLMRRATYAAVAVAGTLVVVKLVAYVMTGSVALLSSLIDSALDSAASIVNLIAVRQALQPADEEHRFGHGKAEPLAGLGQAAFITGSSVFLLFEAFNRLWDPQPVTQGWVGIGVMIFAIVATIGLVAYQKSVVARTNSVAVNADSLHYTGDVLINVSVIVSILLSTLAGFPYADPIFAIGIAAFLLWNAKGIFTDSLDLLMDRELEEEDRERILAIAREHPLVHDAHDLRTRSSGQQQFIQLHLELDRDLTLVKAHAIAEQVDRQIREAFPQADVLIHQDPVGIVEEHHDDLAYQDKVLEPGEVPKE
ncbi:Cobalt-zinc-cadmium resistance protein [Caenispirillum salinarum AK4]|uniref:Cation-efflux pump FieF n=1 Tax=Caenispirillum salinarum AK4 TaxID=1238182 RepID=K9HA68_9PROT|nr:cation diffusion facilitator family transporter [Caenispirillum salinarum]EKV27498.1 Cobalt-zinc-cadmium resistance protein [Caenispirillum salinarum AK4]